MAPYRTNEIDIRTLSYTFTFHARAIDFVAAARRAPSQSQLSPVRSKASTNSQKANSRIVMAIRQPNLFNMAHLFVLSLATVGKRTNFCNRSFVRCCCRVSNHSISRAGCVARSRIALPGFCGVDRGRTTLPLAASDGDIPRMAFARRPVAESRGLNHHLIGRSRV